MTRPLRTFPASSWASDTTSTSCTSIVLTKRKEKKFPESRNRTWSLNDPLSGLGVSPKCDPAMCAITPPQVVEIYSTIVLISGILLTCFVTGTPSLTQNAARPLEHPCAGRMDIDTGPTRPHFPVTVPMSLAITRHMSISTGTVLYSGDYSSRRSAVRRLETYSDNGPSTRIGRTQGAHRLQAPTTPCRAARKRLSSTGDIEDETCNSGQKM